MSRYMKQNSGTVTSQTVTSNDKSRNSNV